MIQTKKIYIQGYAIIIEYNMKTMYLPNQIIKTPLVFFFSLDFLTFDCSMFKRGLPNVKMRFKNLKKCLPDNPAGEYNQNHHRLRETEITFQKKFNSCIFGLKILKILPTNCVFSFFK